MKSVVIGIAAAVAGLIVAFGATTWWALEWDGVAIIETRSEGGELRSTHVWYTEPDGELWLEAGTPRNPWFLDIQRDPVLSFRVDGRTTRYTARLDEDPSGHSRIRSLMREKYGLRDRWVALLFDTSGSLAVGLTTSAAARR